MVLVNCHRRITSTLWAIYALGSAGCGSSSPGAPSQTVLTGEWKATTRITDISSPDCIASLYQGELGGQLNQSLQIVQNGSAVTVQNIALPSLTPKFSWSCQFGGTVNNATLDITETRCEGGGFTSAVSNLECFDGSLRDIDFSGTTYITGSINGNLVIASEVDRYTVYPGGTWSHGFAGVAPVGFMTLTSSVVMSKQ